MHHRQLIHIGLNKAGSTSLQLNIFPKLHQLKKIFYHDTWGARSRDHILGLKNFEDSSQFPELQHSPDNILSVCSWEGAFGVNPSEWKNYGKCLFNTFGNGAEILIILRSPESYFKSLYQERYSRGLLCSASQFFIGDEQWDEMVQKYGANAYLYHYPVDIFNFSALIRIYTKYFKKVKLVALPCIREIKILANILEISLSTTQIKNLDELSKKSNANKGYSAEAMALSAKRNLYLSKTNLFRHNIYNYHYAQETIGSDFTIDKSSKSSLMALCASYFEYKYHRKASYEECLFILGFEWRNMIKEYFDKLCERSSWELPKNIYLGKHHASNQNIYNKVLNSQGLVISGE